MPVAPRTRFDPRTAVALGLAAVALVLVLGFGVWVLFRSGDVEVRLGDSDFRHINADRISVEIADRGPILWPDAGGGSRDFILQHLGADPESGWLAFDARRPGQSRDCFFEWQVDERVFVNTCDDADVVDERGTGLRHFDVRVVEGDVRIDISAASSSTAEP